MQLLILNSLFHLLIYFTLWTITKKKLSLWLCLSYYFIEPPDTPFDVKLNDISSRTVRLSWSPPFGGNTRITKYYIYLEETTRGNGYGINRIDSMGSQIRNITIPSSEVSWSISDLLPMTNYSISVAAVNSLGISDPSPPITFQTEEEG